MRKFLAFIACIALASCQVTIKAELAAKAAPIPPQAAPEKPAPEVMTQEQKEKTTELLDKAIAQSDIAPKDQETNESP